MPATLVTWNVQGRKGVDAQAVSERLRPLQPSTVFLQEVPRTAAMEISRLVGASSTAWGFKHWSIVARPEGLAVLGIESAVPTTTSAVTNRWRWWSWRRRILQEARLDVDGVEVSALHIHLTPHASETKQRSYEVAQALSRLRDRSRAIIVGDLNERPGGPVTMQLTAAGLHDAWESAANRSGDGMTNWSGSRTGPPNQRLDYVFHGDALHTVSAAVPVEATDKGWASWAAVSDHVPVTVTVSVTSLMSREAR